MTKTCPDCKATVLSTSQRERMGITDSMIEAAARVHNPFAFDIAGTPMPVHRAQSRNEARKEVRAILSAALAAAPAVDRARLINAIDSPTVEALARVWTMRSDKSCSEQIVEILAPLLCRPATPAVDATQGALALYLNEVQPVDGRVQINISIDELAVLRHLPAAAPMVGGEAVAWFVPSDETGLCRIWWRDKERAEAWLTKHPTCTLMPLYAAPPASPLRGREAIRKILSDHFWTGEPGQHDAIEAATNILSASPPERPASPLRGREIEDADDLEFLDLEHLDGSASPPERPAADPIAAADKEHADLLRRLATVPDKEK